MSSPTSSTPSSHQKTPLRLQPAIPPGPQTFPALSQMLTGLERRKAAKVGPVFGSGTFKGVLIYDEQVVHLHLLAEGGLVRCRAAGEELAGAHAAGQGLGRREKGKKKGVTASKSSRCSRWELEEHVGKKVKQRAPWTWVKGHAPYTSRDAA